MADSKFLPIAYACCMESLASLQGGGKKRLHKSQRSIQIVLLVLDYKYIQILPHNLSIH